MMPEVLGALTRRRWGGLPILAVAVTLLALDGLLVLPHAGGNVNQWDVFLGVFDDPLVAAVIVPIAFFSLTIDLAPSTFAEQAGYFALGRQGTRWRWWVNKVTALGLLTGIFIGIVWLTAMLVSWVAVPWALTWSRWAAATTMHYPGGLSPAQLRQPPPLIMGMMTLLVSGGLYAWGLVVLVVGWITQQAIWGWVTGAVLAMASYGLWMVHGSGTLWAWAPMNQLLLSVHRGFRPSEAPGLPSVGLSLLIDVFIGTLAIIVGFIVFRRRIL